MRDWPKSRHDAVKYRYGAWAGNPNGRSWNSSCCAAEIWTVGRGSMATQCSKKHGHGPDGIYCKTHALSVAPAQSFTAWYVKKEFGYGIEEIQLSGGTDKSVTLADGSRRAREDHYGRYFSSKEEAVDYAIKFAENHIESAKSKIEAAEKFIESVRVAGREE